MTPQNRGRDATWYPQHLVLARHLAGNVPALYLAIVSGHCHHAPAPVSGIGLVRRGDEQTFVEFFLGL